VDDAYSEDICSSDGVPGQRSLEGNEQKSLRTMRIINGVFDQLEETLKREGKMENLKEPQDE
jgi:hypothetical protein